jgi:uncharacterized protein (DUF305 family)
MNRRVTTVLALATICACAKHQPPPSNNVAPAPQPAPTAAAAAPAAPPPSPKGYTPADVHFMAGMIGHHAQAIEMAKWAPTHGASPAVQRLCERIVVGQSDEIAMTQRWLREHGEYVPPADPRGHIMPGMDQPMLMPGMLTPQQMAQLDSARGPEFDRLFLTFMIQHHQGAITMVMDLLAVPGAAQDGPVFRFANDVNVDQTTEINRMQLMLDALKRSSQ